MKRLNLAKYLLLETTVLKLLITDAWVHWQLPIY
jgi:hypothetical protein